MKFEEDLDLEASETTSRLEDLVVGAVVYITRDKNEGGDIFIRLTIDELDSLETAYQKYNGLTARGQLGVLNKSWYLPRAELFIHFDRVIQLRYNIVH